MFLDQHRKPMKPKITCMEKKIFLLFCVYFFGEATTNESWFVLWEILPYFCVCGLAEN